MTTETLSSHDVFSFLQPQQLKTVSNVSEVISFPAGETVFNSGEPASFLYAVLEGQVSLDLPREAHVNLHIEDLPTGALFGSCMCFAIDKYTLTATSVTDTKLLKISADQLKHVMDNDPATGYQIQRLVSRTYFKRYLDTMKRLQTIAEALVIRAG
jgi:CRP/FNR family cyclic AMP-dependent transcriptional regulator